MATKRPRLPTLFATQGYQEEDQRKEDSEPKSGEGERERNKRGVGRRGHGWGWESDRGRRRGGGGGGENPFLTPPRSIVPGLGTSVTIEEPSKERRRTLARTHSATYVARPRTKPDFPLFFHTFTELFPSLRTYLLFSRHLDRSLWTGGEERPLLRKNQSYPRTLFLPPSSQVPTAAAAAAAAGATEGKRKKISFLGAIFGPKERQGKRRRKKGAPSFLLKVSPLPRPIPSFFIRLVVKKRKTTKKGSRDTVYTRSLFLSSATKGIFAFYLACGHRAISASSGIFLPTSKSSTVSMSASLKNQVSFISPSPSLSCKQNQLEALFAPPPPLNLLGREKGAK